jgi:hypothetical protein
MDAASALGACRMVVSCGYVGSPWMAGRDGVGKLSMSSSGDGRELAAILIGRAWWAPCWFAIALER